MYSQGQEEKYVLQLLGDIPSIALRSFLDIGAWSAKTFSNTRALFELGWGGVLIEPSPGPVKNLVREYGTCDRVQVIAAAVSVEGGLVELTVTDDAVSSRTEDRQRIEQWKAEGGFYGRLTVPSLSVKQLFDHFGGDFQMVSLDTEGTSVDLFKEMIRIGPRPRCVVVEHDSRFVELTQIAMSGDYQMVYEDGNNRVYRWGAE